MESGKDTKKDFNNFVGQPLFNQIINYLPENEIRNIVYASNSDKYYKHFKTKDQLILMLFGVFSKCNSMNELCAGFTCLDGKLKYLGLKSSYAKSTAGDGLRERNHTVFQKIYFAVKDHSKKFLSVSQKEYHKLKKLFIIDSTTISLFTNIMKGVGRNCKGDGKKKGGLKVHVSLDAHSETPDFVIITSANRHDKNFLKSLKLEPYSVVVFDKAYYDFKIYSEWTKENISFVGRLKTNAKYDEIEVLYENKITDKCKGVLKDSKINLKFSENGEEKTLTIRKVNYIDDKGKKFNFISNNFSLTSLEIANLYKKRWIIETLFKQIKQNFQLKYFYSETENGIKTQVWCTLIAHILLLIVNAIANVKKAFSTVCTIVRIHLISLKDIIWLIRNNNRTYLKNNRKNKPPPKIENLELNFGI